MTKHRFSCPCGKVNQFSVKESQTPRDVTVRCGACHQMCKIRVPASPKEDILDILRSFVDGIK